MHDRNSVRMVEHQLPVRTLAGASVPIQADGPGETVAALRARIAPHLGCGAGCRLFLDVRLHCTEHSHWAFRLTRSW